MKKNGGVHRLKKHIDMRISTKPMTRELGTAQVLEMSRKKLLSYADGFYELAKSYDGEFRPEEHADKQELLAEHRLWENRQILMGHMNEMAKIMTEVACQVLLMKPFEERDRRRLLRRLRVEGILAKNPCYFVDEAGHRSITLTMQTIKASRMSAEEVGDLIGVILDQRLLLSDKGPFFVDTIPRHYIFAEEPGYTVFTGYARATKEGEAVSGDHYAFLEEKGGLLTMLLSDGTGAGERAGADSERVLDLMERLLEAGYSTETAIQMTNTALYAAYDEINHPSMDVCDIDLYSGSCEIRKAGAAGTFLKHGGSAELLLWETLPLGIVRQPELQVMHRKLEDGDYVIMVSDGIVDAFQEAAYEEALCEVIGRLEEQNPGAIANRILQAAVIGCGGRIMDDMTVLVAGIWKQ